MLSCLVRNLMKTPDISRTSCQGTSIIPCYACYVLTYYIFLTKTLFEISCDSKLYFLSKSQNCVHKQSIDMNLYSIPNPHQTPLFLIKKILSIKMDWTLFCFQVWSKLKITNQIKE